MKFIPNTTISTFVFLKFYRSPVHATFNKSSDPIYCTHWFPVSCKYFACIIKTKGHKFENVRLLISFEKAFINDFYEYFYHHAIGNFPP